MKSLKETGGLILFLLVFAFIVSRLLGCLPVEAKRAAAEATYLGQQLECVDNLETKADIDGCRNSVKRRWARDAGGDR